MTSSRPWPLRLAAACGFTAGALALFVPIIGAGAEPSYSHAAQFISELGAAGAANPKLVASAGFAPIGVLVLLFLACAASAMPRSWRCTVGLICFAAVGNAYLIAAWFPCDAGCPVDGSWSQSVHNLFGLLEYVGAVAGLLLLASALQGAPAWRAMVPVCVGCALLVAAGLVTMLVPGLHPYRGLSQRVAEAGIFGWVAFLSGFLLRATKSGR
jgi:hypothetical protein